MSAKKIRTRRTRRQNNQALKHGFNAKPTHRALHGRTGNSMRLVGKAINRLSATQRAKRAANRP